MKIIGLCGGSGSGKGTVASLFSGFGIPSVDTDKVYRELTEGDSPCLEELVGEFGKDILSSNGSLNRKALSDIVFSSPYAEERRKRLNEITHKHILSRTREILEEYRVSGKSAAIVDAPLLFESCFDRECDIIISVISDIKIRISRIIKRDGISESDALVRIKSQLSDEELKKRSDHFIVNNGDLNELSIKVKEIAEEILK